MRDARVGPDGIKKTTPRIEAVGKNVGKEWSKPCRLNVPDHAGRIAFRLGRIEYCIGSRTAALRPRHDCWGINCGNDRKRAWRPEFFDVESDPALNIHYSIKKSKGQFFFFRKKDTISSPVSPSCTTGRGRRDCHVLPFRWASEIIPQGQNGGINDFSFTPYGNDFPASYNWAF